MLLRFLTIALLTVSLSACSSTDDEAATDPSLMGSNTMSSGPLEGTEVYDGNQMGGVAGQGLPGSQEDLATNVGDRVFFGYDRYDLASEAQTTLDGQATWLAKYPSVNVTIEGHSDERGTRGIQPCARRTPRQCREKLPHRPWRCPEPRQHDQLRQRTAGRCRLDPGFLGSEPPRRHPRRIVGERGV